MSPEGGFGGAEGGEDPGEHRRRAMLELSEGDWVQGVSSAQFWHSEGANQTFGELVFNLCSSASIWGS